MALAIIQVDYMLSTFMEEMQITPEQFEVACLAGKQNNSTSGLTFHQGLFQQVSTSSVGKAKWTKQ